jgi:hypothetical protein
MRDHFAIMVASSEDRQIPTQRGATLTLLGAADSLPRMLSTTSGAAEMHFGPESIAVLSVLRLSLVAHECAHGGHGLHG